MSVIVEKNANASEILIRIQGRFDFSTHRQFRDAVKTGNGAATRYIIDLAGTEYMDSSALGMLLLLREEAGGESANISLQNPRPEIRKIFDISNFHKMFQVT